VTELLIPLMREIGDPPRWSAIALAARWRSQPPPWSPVPRLATIAAPWRFSAFRNGAGATGRALGRRATDCRRPRSAADGSAAKRILEPRSARTLGKFELFADLPSRRSKGAQLRRARDWANDGPPIGAAAAREMFDAFLARDLPGAGNWSVGGRSIDPATLPCPAFHILSTTDRIVPAASAPPGGDRLELGLGHVGMVVGSRGREALWEPLDRWLSKPATG
jgi:polyhydroxyalkanoate synthase